jgi:large subunit ribosomal protein L4
MYRAGVRSILSQLAREDRLAVVEKFEVEAPKTKLVASKLKQMGVDSVLLITDSFDENLHLATRNLQSIAIVEPEYCDPVSLVYFDRVLITRAALAKVEEMLS